MTNDQKIIRAKVGLLELAKRSGLADVYIHAFTDGRDSPPTSGAGYLADVEKEAEKIGVGRIASICGRFYAMDRDSRWERVQKCWEERRKHFYQRRKHFYLMHLPGH